MEEERREVYQEQQETEFLRKQLQSLKGVVGLVLLSVSSSV
jgi:hypothetical protein